MGWLIDFSHFPNCQYSITDKIRAGFDGWFCSQYHWPNDLKPIKGKSECHAVEEE
jgi:hypothetical protein